MGYFFVALAGRNDLTVFSLETEPEFTGLVSLRYLSGCAKIYLEFIKKVGRMKKCLSLFLILNILVGSCLAFAGSNAYAASGSSLSRLSAKKVSLDIGVRQTIKLKNAKAKVKWNSSNKKIAVVIKKRGRYGSTVTVKAKKHGKCTVTAVSGGKRYK